VRQGGAGSYYHREEHKEHSHTETHTTTTTSHSSSAGPYTTQRLTQPTHHSISSPVLWAVSRLACSPPFLCQRTCSTSLLRAHDFVNCIFRTVCPRSGRRGHHPAAGR
jgi:hypothetical protein